MLHCFHYLVEVPSSRSPLLESTLRSLADASSFCCCPGYDMIRKLLLVGMLVMAGRGSVAQLF